jgi:hypothetical protein
MLTTRPDFCQAPLETLLVCPFGYLYFLSTELMNELGLGAVINPCMALTSFPSRIG